MDGWVITSFKSHVLDIKNGNTDSPLSQKADEDSPDAAAASGDDGDLPLQVPRPISHPVVENLIAVPLAGHFQHCPVEEHFNPSEGDRVEDRPFLPLVGVSHEQEKRKQESWVQSC